MCCSRPSRSTRCRAGGGRRRVAHSLRAAEQKLRAASQPGEAIRSFRGAYDRLVAGDSGLIRSDELEPVADVPSLDELAQDGSAALEHVAIIKLAGGLATTMGLRSPKALVEAKDGRSFLDIIIGQTLALRAEHGVRLPLVLMVSEMTRGPTLRALARHGDLAGGLSPDFLQSTIPKLDADTLAPAEWPSDRSLEWCPPGHGDVYGALRRSGMLAALLDAGFRFAMISNSDNLGARADPRIAALLAAEQVPFVMEVALGAPADRKGGHIAQRRSDGRLVLRESAQSAPEEDESFRDFRHWRYYNTNNLWVDLRALARTLDEHEGVLELPLIVNRKTVDPRDPRSPPVLQLESAMGSAIQLFQDARVVCVPRSRFVPVKTTDDLLVMRSDVYRIADRMVVEPIPERDDAPPYVELDKRYYGFLDRFEQRFPAGPPSLKEADRFAVHGDVSFGAGVVVRGSVEIRANAATQIDDATVLTG